MDGATTADTLRGVIGQVYRAGTEPQVHRVITAWRRVGDRPARAPLALATTIGAVVLVVPYVALATVVPLTVAFLLAITSPVLLCVAISNLLER